MEAKSQQIIDYINSNGDAPVRDWLNDLDPVIAARIQARINRLESGNFGDSKSVGSGIYELKFKFGSGYRIYFAKHGESIVLLLCGGDKSTQSKDIEIARLYWADFERRAE